MNDNPLGARSLLESLEAAVSEQWYYEQHGTPHGPLAREQLAQLIRQGAIGPATLVWREGLTDWLTAAAAGFGAESRSSSLPPPLPVPPPVVTTAPVFSRPPLAPPKSGYRPPPPAMNWPLVLGGGVAALIVAIALGWFANSLLNQRPEPERVVAAAPPAPENVSPIETNPIPATPTSPPAPAATLPSARPSPIPPAEPAPPTPPAEPASSLPATSPMSAAPPAVSSPPQRPATPPSSLAPSTPSSSTPAPQPEPTNEPRTLYQEIDVQRAPKFSLLGSMTAQDLHYQMLSDLRVSAADDKGLRKIDQYVRDTKLLKADELSRGMFEQSLKDLVGWQFTFQVNRRGDILEWKGGPPAGRKAARVERGAELGFMVTSVMDEDGWKEMAQLSFFVPEEQTAGSQTWVRKMTHDFGPLGSWEGETHYTPKEASNPLQIDYVHRMTYKPPAKGIGGLPFTITEANFKPEIAAGTFHYDKQAGRVIQVQERFLVKGALSTELLGTAAAVEMEEDQLITVRMLEKNPWE
jgi:hypothetical protein